MNTELIVYGTNWCYGCRRAKILLDKHKIKYQFIDIDSDQNARIFVEKVNRGYRSVPTIIFPDGSRLIEPNDRDLVDSLNKLQVGEFVN